MNRVGVGHSMSKKDVHLITQPVKDCLTDERTKCFMTGNRKVARFHRCFI